MALGFRGLARAEVPDASIITRIATQVGGSFGGKGDHLLRMLSCVGTRVTGRAVRVTLSREDSLRYHNKRHPFEMHEKLAVAAMRNNMVDHDRGRQRTIFQAFNA